MITKLKNSIADKPYRILILGIVCFILLSFFLPFYSGVHTFGYLDVQTSNILVNSPVSAKIRQINIKSGDYVESGQALVELDAETSKAYLHSSYVDAIKSYAALKFFKYKMPDDYVDVMHELSTRSDYQKIFDNAYDLIASKVKELQAKIVIAQSDYSRNEKVEKSIKNNTLDLEESIKYLKEAKREGLISDSQFLDGVNNITEIYSITSYKKDSLKAQFELAKNSYSGFLEEQLVINQKQFVTSINSYKNYSNELNSTEVKSPVKGQVIQSNAKYVGQYLQVGQQILELVSFEEKLSAKVKINPNDIAFVKAGDIAEVRISTSNAKSSPMLVGTVKYVTDGAHQTDNPNMIPEYSALIDIDISKDKLASLGVSPKSGMPIEVFIKGGKSTLFDYLAKPFKRLFVYSFSEH